MEEVMAQAVATQEGGGGYDAADDLDADAFGGATSDAIRRSVPGEASGWKGEGGRGGGGERERSECFRWRQ